MAEQAIPNGSNVSLCPAEKIMANQRYDLSRGYIPVLLVIALFIGGFGAAFQVGGWLEAYKRERSAVLSRLDGLEAKLDKILGLRQPAKK
ncbi:MAG: hypothetical protein ACLP7P_11860 [Rhodomicrobium sp.]